MKPTPLVNKQQVSSVPKTANGSLSTIANGSNAVNGIKNGLRHDDFLKKEYELARNQVISKNTNDSNGNTKTQNENGSSLINLNHNLTNSVSNNIININNNSSNNLVNVNGRNIINVRDTNKDEDDNSDELNEVRKKILKNKLNSPKLNGDINSSSGNRRKMMINGEHVNGEDDLRFIDSDDNSDKQQKLSPPGSAGTTQKCLVHNSVSKSASPSPVTVSVNGSPTTSVTLSLNNKQQTQTQLPPPSSASSKQPSQNQITKNHLPNNKSSTPPPPLSSSAILLPNVPASSSSIAKSNNKQPLVVDNNNLNQSKNKANSHQHPPTDNNRVLIYNSATPVSKKKQLFITSNNASPISDSTSVSVSVPASTSVKVQEPNAKDQVTMVTIGGSRIKVITKDESDDDTDVSTSATIILPTKPKPVVVVQNGLPPSSGTVQSGSNGDENGTATQVVTNGETNNTDLSSIFLEKKNQTNKLTDINDSVSYNFDLLSS